MFFVCRDCDNLFSQDDMHTIDYGRVCESCYDESYFCCDDCGYIYHNDRYATDGLCEDCHIRRTDDEDEDDNPYVRHYHKGDKYTEPKKRAYSCEIECYYNTREDFEKVAEETNQDIGVTDDGSLQKNGKEFQTPKLSGEVGEKLLQELCMKLVKNDFHVDKTCGLHIHLDTSDMAGNFERIRNTMLFYLYFEPVIYSYLPFSRRTNRYCMPLAQFYHEDEIIGCDTVEQLEKIWYREQEKGIIDDRKKNKYDTTRYAGVNMHSMLSNGHIEIRHHSGTIDYTKIKNWITLHLAILDKAQRIPLSELVKIKFILDLKQRQAKMFEFLKLDKTLQDYFLARNKKFGKELTEEITCAE